MFLFLSQDKDSVHFLRAFWELALAQVQKGALHRGPFENVEIATCSIKYIKWIKSWCNFLLMSNEKDPCCLGFIGDYTSQFYRDYDCKKV